MTESIKQPRYQGLFLHPLILLIMSLIGLGLSGLFALLFAAAGIMGVAQKSLPGELLSLFTMAFTALMVGGLFLLPVTQAILQLSGRETRFAARGCLPIAAIIMVLWVPLLLLGQTLASRQILPWLLLPPLQMVLIAAPIFFLIELARRKLLHPEGGGWGVYGIGVLFTQPLVIIAEMVVLAVLGAGLLIWLSSQPALWEEITQLAEHLSYAQMDARLMQQILLPYLQSPAVLIGILAVGAGILPLLEELLKPLAVWVMAGRRMDESTGFVLGAFAGGTFALLESLGMAASTSLETWGSVLTARVGTGVLHVTTTALMGWALASAWKNRRYVRLGLTYLLSFTLHAVWNAFGLALGLTTYLPGQMSRWMKTTGSIVLVVMAVGMVLLLAGMNLRLQRRAANRQPAAELPTMPAEAADLPAPEKDADAQEA